MQRSTTRLYRIALRWSMPTVGQVAEDLGYHRNTLDAYLNRQPPSRAAVKRLAAWLRAQSRQFAEYADRLEAELRGPAAVDDWD